MYLVVTFVLATVLLLVYAFFVYHLHYNDFWKKQGVFQIDVTSISPLWKRLTQIVTFAEFNHEVYKALGEERYGGYTELGRPVLVVRDLDLLKQIFVKDFDHFVDRPVITINKSDKVSGKMLVSKVGKEWKDLRSAMTPAFTAGKIKRMFHLFNACGHQMATFLKESGQEEIDFQDAFGRYTLGVIGSVAFGLDAETFTKEDSIFRKMVKQIQRVSTGTVFKTLLNILMPRLVGALKLSLSDPESIRFFSAIVESKMRQRRETGEKHQDFLQLMLDAQDGRLRLEKKEELDTYEKDAQFKNMPNKKDSPVEFDDDNVLAQCLLFFFGGADTLESLLTFVAYELAMNPDSHEKLAQEVIPVMAQNDGNIFYDDVQDLKYLDMVVHETLRLHPPAFGTERLFTSEYTIPSTNIVLPVGTRVVISINGIHKDQRIYGEPLRFNPENFSVENKAKRHPYSWLPFGQGPRSCIAMRFAMMEAKAAIAHLVYNFIIQPSANTPEKVKLSKRAIIRKPANGMRLKFLPREAILG